jgi:DNA-binding FrmR family transcriptional regulator
MISDGNRDSMVKRLARIEGQIRGIQKLIQQENMDCEKIAQQMSAARKALDKAAHSMLACMIEQEVLHGEKQQSMEEMTQLISKYA